MKNKWKVEFTTMRSIFVVFILLSKYGKLIESGFPFPGKEDGMYISMLTNGCKQVWNL